MLSSIEAKNYKAFKHVHYKFLPLTVLTGPNSTGKTSLLQALRMFVQTANSFREETRPLKINGPDVRFISPFELFHKSDQENELVFKFTFNPSTSEITNLSNRVRDSLRELEFIAHRLGVSSSDKNLKDTSRRLRRRDDGKYFDELLRIITTLLSVEDRNTKQSNLEVLSSYLGFLDNGMKLNLAPNEIYGGSKKKVAELSESYLNSAEQLIKFAQLIYKLLLKPKEISQEYKFGLDEDMNFIVKETTFYIGSTLVYKIQSSEDQGSVCILGGYSDSHVSFEKIQKFDRFYSTRSNIFNCFKGARGFPIVDILSILNSAQRSWFSRINVNYVGPHRRKAESIYKVDENDGDHYIGSVLSEISKQQDVEGNINNLSNELGFEIEPLELFESIYSLNIKSRGNDNNVTSVGFGCPSSYKMAQVSARAKRDFAHLFG